MGQDKKIIVGGVPEHFNLPWWLAIIEGAFDGLGHEVIWREFPDGTGAMMRAVEAGEVDIALVLTEGAVAHIATRKTTAIIGTWVDSPLVWGVHGASGTEPSPNFPHDGRIAISRQGSGSHLMPLVHARQEGWSEPLVFVEVGTLAGALDAFANNVVDAFYWERTMTWPHCDAQQMALLGTFSAPWPAFVAVSERSRIAGLSSVWAEILTRMEAFTKGLLSTRRRFVEQVAERFQLPTDEVDAWLTRTHFSPALQVSREGVLTCANELVAAGILTEFPDLETLVHAPGVWA